MEGDIHQMQADLDNMLAQSKSAEEKAKKAMVDAGRLADELRAEQDHTNAQDKVRRTIGTLCSKNNVFLMRKWLFSFKLISNILGR